MSLMDLVRKGMMMLTKGIWIAGKPATGRMWFTALMMTTALTGVATPRWAMAAEPSATAEQLAQSTEQRNFHIAAQSLADALPLFGQQAGLQVTAEAEAINGLASPGVQGSMAPGEALVRLLSGTGLAWRMADAKTVVLEKAGAAGAMELGPVTVEGLAALPPQAEIGNLSPAYAGGQVARGSKLGILGNRDIMDTPFNTTAYTSDLIKNQEARTVSDVLENDPSVRFSTPGGHVQEHFMIRGFETNSSDMALNGMFGLLPPGHVPTEFVERVELIKGPNALLTGLSPIGSVGGLVNLTPKRANDTPVNDITVDYTSGAQYGTHADVGRRFGTDGRFGVRFNGVYRDGETGVEGESKESQLAALALDYRGKDVRLSFDTYASRELFDGGSPFDAMMITGATSVPNAPDSDTNIFRGIYGQQESNAAVARGEYDIDKNLTAYASLGVMNHRQNGYITSTHAVNTTSTGAYVVSGVYRRDFTDSLSSEVGLRGNFNTGEIGHQMVLGYTRLEQENGTTNTSISRVASNIYAPITPPLAPISGEPYTSDISVLSSLALTDTLSAMDDRIQLTLGARHQRVESEYFNTGGQQTSKYDKDVLTPAVGLVVKPLPQVSLYGNYIEGLTKGSQVTATTATNRGTVFDPYVSKQVETGIKWDAGKIANTLSVFQITKRSQTVFNNFYSEGEQRNRGIEWNTFGQVADSVRVLGGLTYLTSEYTKHPNADVRGKEAWGVPDWQGNLGVEWDTPMLAGLTLEGRTVYTSKQYINSTNTLSIPEWWRFDVGARYTVPVHETNLTIRGYVTNLLDANYWAGTFSDGMINLSEGRTFMLSTTVGF